MVRKPRINLAATAALKPELAVQAVVVIGGAGAPAKTKEFVLRAPPILSLAAIAERNLELVPVLALGALGVLVRTKAALPVLLKTVLLAVVLQELKPAKVIANGIIV